MYRGERGLYSVLQIPRLLAAQKAPREIGLFHSFADFQSAFLRTSPLWSRMWDPVQWPAAPATVLCPNPPNEGVLAGIYAPPATTAGFRLTAGRAGAADHHLPLPVQANHAQQSCLQPQERNGAQPAQTSLDGETHLLLPKAVARQG